MSHIIDSFERGRTSWGKNPYGVPVRSRRRGGLLTAMVGIADCLLLLVAMGMILDVW